MPNANEYRLTRYESGDFYSENYFKIDENIASDASALVSQKGAKDNLLLRTSNDWSGYSKKYVLDDSDLILIEDSGSSYAKKTVPARFIGQAFNRLIPKIANETRISDTSPSQDGQLNFTVGSNENWHVKAKLIIHDENGSSGNIGFKYYFDIPNGATIKNGTLIDGQVGALNVMSGFAPIDFSTEQVIDTEAGSYRISQIDFLLQTSVDGGQVRFMWSQNNNRAYNLTLLENSYLEVKIY